MENPLSRIPFDPYDFFGYLTSGLLLIVGMDLVIGFPHVLGQDIKVIEGAILLLAIYVTGQMIATPAKTILEDWLVAKILYRPSINLFQENKGVWSRIFPGYYKPFPVQTREKILDKIRSEGVKGLGEDLFLHVRYSPTVLQDQKLMEKLNSFLNKYGFNRNLSFSSFIVGLAILIKILICKYDPDLMKYSIAALISAFLLLYRYLKFFRQYSYEMFNTYGRAK
jgi:hypothetical protein